MNLCTFYWSIECSRYRPMQHSALQIWNHVLISSNCGWYMQFIGPDVLNKSSVCHAMKISVGTRWDQSKSTHGFQIPARYVCNVQLFFQSRKIFHPGSHLQYLHSISSQMGQYPPIETTTSHNNNSNNNNRTGWGWKKTRKCSAKCLYTLQVI